MTGNKEEVKTEETIKEEPPKGIAWYHPAFLIATWFGSGKIPFAPGTMGSFFTFPLFIVSHYLLIFATSEKTLTHLSLLGVVLLFFIGQWATSVYMKRTGRMDPKEVVIDEVVGQILVFFAGFTIVASALPIYHVLYGDAEQNISLKSIKDVHDFFLNTAIFIPYTFSILIVSLVGFILFRIFDIWKPWPIRWCDKNMKNSFGVMFDDIFAAVYAILVMYLLVFLIAIFFFDTGAIPSQK
jgi:phosphatidylglycerophosphatase A